MINTHWHGDHAGGNEAFAKAGATLFASDNVRKRLTGEAVTTGRTAQARAASPKEAWPVVTFDERHRLPPQRPDHPARSVRRMPAHTDGDTFIYFVEADVLHTGDTYMKDRYPFVDTGSGGTQAGFIAALEALVKIAGPNTKVIPGHGELATQGGSRGGARDAQGRTGGGRGAGESGQDAGEDRSRPSRWRKWTPRFGGAGSFISDDAYVTVIYNELTKK